MSTANGTHDSKQHTASNWNVLRSKGVPSSVSGSHNIAASAGNVSAVRIQTSDEILTIKARKSPAVYEKSGFPLSKP